MNRRLHLALAAAMSGAALLTAAQAAAHTKLVTSNPIANAVVAAPKVITLTFSEKVAPAFSGFDLTMVEHNMKIPVKTTVSKDGKTVTGTPQGAFMKGSYKINWHAASGDGHRMTGEVAFKVN
ncbi:MAG: copper homeostasis periplasmic binding protein CopC [Phenylobacterium sp.]|nr:copper homeostasis periplasmic binding protein CopC [Phenylobacterium sp.]